MARVSTHLFTDAVVSLVHNSQYTVPAYVADAWFCFIRPTANSILQETTPAKNVKTMQLFFKWGKTVVGICTSTSTSSCYI